MTENKNAKNIELREENSRHLMGKIPVSLILWGYLTVIVTIAVSALIYFLIL